MAGTYIDYVLYGATLCLMWNLVIQIIPKCTFVARMPFFVFSGQSSVPPVFCCAHVPYLISDRLCWW